MKRKLVRSVLLLCGLFCVMGADSISFNAGQPNPNPGGMKNLIEANGTYTLDPGHMYACSTFTADDGVKSTFTTSANNGTWTLIATPLPAGTYDCYASLVVNDGKKLWSVNSTTKSVTVK